MLNNRKKDKNIGKTFVFKQLILILVFMLCFENVCFSHENLAPESIFGPLNGEQVNQIGELEAHILMKLLDASKNGTNFLEQAKIGRSIQDIVITRPIDQTKELTVVYDMQKVQKESKILPNGYYIVPSTYDSIQYYHFIKFGEETYDIATFTAEEYSRLNKDRLKDLAPLPTRKEGDWIKGKRKHEIEIDSIIWEKSKQGNLKQIQNTDLIIKELLTLVSSLEIKELNDQIQTLIERNRFFLITGDVKKLHFVGHASDRGIYLVSGKGENLPALFWEIMKFRGAKQDQELGIRAQILKWQKNKNDKPTIETLKNYLIKNRRETTLRNYPNRAYWGTDENEEQLLLEFSEALSSIEETNELIKKQKKISEIEAELLEQRKEQTALHSNNTDFLTLYVDVLTTLKKVSEKLQKIDLSLKDDLISMRHFYETEIDSQITQIISRLFNANGLSPKQNYRNSVNKFHPDRSSLLRNNVSKGVLENMSIEDKFEKIYSFIQNAWDFYSKKNGNKDERKDNLLKRAKELGKEPEALRKALDVEKVIKIVNQNIKLLETKRDALKQSMPQDTDLQKTLQDLMLKKKQLLTTLDMKDKESLKHKQEATITECKKALKATSAKKEEAENHAEKIFVDKVRQINKEKEKNKKAYEQECLPEYRKKEKAIEDAEEKCSQKYRKIRKCQDQAKQEFSDKCHKAYQTEKQAKKAAENTYHSEWKKISDRETVAIENIEKKDSQEWEDSQDKLDQAKKVAESVFDQEEKKLKDTKNKLISDAKKAYKQGYKKIKAPENTAAHEKEWSKIIKTEEKILTTAEDTYIKEWHKLNERKKQIIEELGRIFTKDFHEREKKKEDAIKREEHIFTTEDKKLESEKNKAIKNAEEPYARIVKEEKESEAMFKQEIDKIFEEQGTEIETIKQGYSELQSEHTRANDELDKKLEQAKTDKKSALKDAEGEFKRKKTQAILKKDMLTKAINQLLETDSHVSVSEETVPNAKSLSEQTIPEAKKRLSNNPEGSEVNAKILNLNQRGTYGKNSLETEEQTIEKHKRGMNSISKICPQPVIPSQKTLVHVICKDLVKDWREGLDTIFVTDLLKIERNNRRDDKIREKIEFVSKHTLLDRVSILSMDPNNLVDVALSDMTFIEKLPEKVKLLVFELDSSSNFINIHGVLSALRALQNDDITTLMEIYKILTGRKFTQMEQLRSLDSNNPKYYQKLAKLIIFQLPPIVIYNDAELKNMNSQMLCLLESA